MNFKIKQSPNDTVLTSTDLGANNYPRPSYLCISPFVFFCLFFVVVFSVLRCAIPCYLYCICALRCAIPGLDNDTYEAQGRWHSELIQHVIPWDADADGFSSCHIYTHRNATHFNNDKSVFIDPPPPTHTHLLYFIGCTPTCSWVHYIKLSAPPCLFSDLFVWFWFFVFFFFIL
jgi:hypothetical protein